MTSKPSLSAVTLIVAMPSPTGRRASGKGHLFWLVIGFAHLRGHRHVGLPRGAGWQVAAGRRRQVEVGAIAGSVQWRCPRSPSWLCL